MEINKHIIFYPLDSKFIKKCTTSAGVYMIRNILNSKSYIGSSYSLKRRLTDHLSHLKYNRLANHHLQSAYNKYGQKSFVFCILEQCEPILETVLMLEQKYLDLKPEYNNAIKAGSNKGFKKTKQQALKTAIGLYGKPKPYGDWYKYKEYNKQIKNANYRNPNNMTPVLQFDLDHNLVAEYDSIAEAARSINKGYSCIRDACKKRQLSAYGFLWEYKNEEDKKKVLKERRGKWKSIVR